MAYAQPQMCSSQSVFFEGLQGSIHRTKVTHGRGMQVKLRCLNMVTGLGIGKYLGV